LVKPAQGKFDTGGSNIIAKLKKTRRKKNKNKAPKAPMRAASLNAAIAILNIGRMNDGVEQEA